MIDNKKVEPTKKEAKEKVEQTRTAEESVKIKVALAHPAARRLSDNYLR